MRRFKGIRVLLPCFLFALALCPIQAFALSPGVDPAVSSQVVRSGDVNTFTNNMPFANYRIYPSYLTLDNTSASWHGTNINYYVSGVTLKDYFYDQSAGLYSRHRNSLVYTGDVAAGATKNLSGNVFGITYTNAAIDSAGVSHDVRLTISNVSIKNYSTKTIKSVTLASGALSLAAFCYDASLNPATIDKAADPEATVRSHVISKVGVSMDVKIEVLDAESGGKLNFNFRDIDQPDRNAASYDGTYSERVEIASGDILSKAYLTSSSNSKLYVSQGSRGLLFRGTQSDDGATFNTGFAIQVDPVNTTLYWRGGACGTSMPGASYTVCIRPLTKLYKNDPIAETWSITDAGGVISMTESADNSVIDWSREPVKYGNATAQYVARFYTNRKPTTIGVGAKEGYRYVGLNKNTTYRSTDPTDGPLTVSNNKANITLDSSNSVNYIAAFYEPLTSSIKVHKADQDGNPMVGVTFTASGTSSVHGPFEVSGTTNANGDAVISNIPYGKATDDYALTEEVPDGYRVADGYENPVVFQYADAQQSFEMRNLKLLTVSYDLEGDATYGVPGDVAVPDSQKNIEPGSDVTLAAPPTTSWTTSDGTPGGIPGTWVFEPSGGWSDTPGSYDLPITGIEGIASDSTVYGRWTFEPDTFTVTYDVGPDLTYGIPEGATTPVDSNAYDYNDRVAVVDNLTTTVDYAMVGARKVSGKWTFIPWDKDDFNITEDTVIHGAWRFTPGIPATGGPGVFPIQLLGFVALVACAGYLTFRKIN